tara:strand:+ start:2300 stop:2956 length:657 start_codon:yes stop_codon:yes gene_type:complete
MIKSRYNAYFGRGSLVLKPHDSSVVKRCIQYNNAPEDERATYTPAYIERMEKLKRVNRATLQENWFAIEIYERFDKILNVDVTLGPYDAVDINCDNKFLGINFHIELKVRYTPQVNYNTILLSQSKIANICGKNKFPCYVVFVNSHEEETLVCKIDSDEFIQRCCKRTYFDNYLIDRNHFYSICDWWKEIEVIIDQSKQYKKLMTDDIFIPVDSDIFE